MSSNLVLEEKVDEGAIQTETIASYAVFAKNFSDNPISPMLFQRAKIILRELEEQYQIEIFSPAKVIYLVYIYFKQFNKAVIV